LSTATGPDADLRRDVCASSVIQPDILVTRDHQTLLRSMALITPITAAGWRMDSLSRRRPRLLPELLIEDIHHMPKSCSLTMQPNVVIDVTDTWHIRLEALLHHKTQIGNIEKFKERMKSRRTEDSTDEDPRYEERFRVVKYR
jgi:LmbE family N-acetylglucosaminyl deacetylase